MVKKDLQPSRRPVFGGNFDLLKKTIVSEVNPVRFRQGKIISYSSALNTVDVQIAGATDEYAVAVVTAGIKLFGNFLPSINQAVWLVTDNTDIFAIGQLAPYGNSLAGYFYKLSANRTLADSTGAQSLFGVGITLSTGISYQFEMLFSVHTTGATSNALGLNFSGTAVVGAIQYKADTTNETTATTPSATLSTYIQVATNSNITATVAASTQRVCSIKGTVNITTGGTFIPNLQYSAVSGASPVVQSGAYIKITPLNEVANNSVGLWA
jgi:hypothetical protein